MALKKLIDSRVVETRYQEETSIGVADTSKPWNLLEPNTFGDWGAEVTNTPRSPITKDRQRRKGNTTGLDASGGLQNDVGHENLQDILQGFFFADHRKKDEITGIAVVDGTGNDFEPTAGGDNYVADDFLFAEGFDDAANNGLHQVTGSPVAASIPVTSSLTTAAGQTGTVSKCGHEFATADIDVDATGTWPALVSSVFNFTTLDLIVGEEVFVGGDAAANQFVNAVNNGFKRVRSIAANRLEFDKSNGDMVNETGTGLDIRIWFGPVLKNEADDTLQVRRTYQLERQLGAPDDAQPTQIQAEYLIGALANEAILNITQESLVTTDLNFVALDRETVDGPTSLKAGSRPSLTKFEAYNTSSNFPLFRIAEVVSGDENPDPLAAYLTEATITINNNATVNKAIGVLGGFEITIGDFVVTGSFTAYFQTEAAQTAVRENRDVTIDFKMVQDNAGVSWDIPLTSLGDGRANVAKGEAITIPLNADAATGCNIDPNLDHTLLLTWFKYLPNLANPGS